MFRNNLKIEKLGVNPVGLPQFTVKFPPMILSKPSAARATGTPVFCMERVLPLLWGLWGVYCPLNFMFVIPIKQDYFGTGYITSIPSSSKTWNASGSVVCMGYSFSGLISRIISRISWPLACPDAWKPLST